MALTDDQKAMLRLLAQREEGYEDMAALMGLSVEEVRAKVKEALADLAEGEQGPSPSPPAEKVDPPAEEPPAPAASKEEEPTEPAAEPEASTPQAPVATVAPPAETPAPPPVAKDPAPRIRPRPTGLSRPQLSLPEDRGARFGLMAGLGAIVVVVILLATGVLGGGDDDSGTSSSTQAGATETGSRQLTQAILKPTDGSDASGRALFGRAGKQVVLQVEAEGLDPSPQGQSYVVWLARSPQQMLPLAATKVDDSGEIVARYQVPTEVLGFLAGGAFDQIAITLIADDAFRRSVAQASKQSKSPAVTGSEVLRGDITGPIVGLARREQARG